MHIIVAGEPTAEKAKRYATRRGATGVSWLTNEGGWQHFRRDSNTGKTRNRWREIPMEEVGS